MMKRSVKAGGSWLFRSLASRLLLVTIVFLAVPVLVYQQFELADGEKNALLLKGAQQQGQLIAAALQPVLQAANGAALPKLGSELARFAGEHTRLKLLLRPAAMAGAQGFYYVAAAPVEPNSSLDLERQQLLDQGVLGRLAESCSGNQSLAIRLPTPADSREVLTSITPTNSAFGCWALVMSHTTDAYLASSIGQPYWRTPEVQAAALIYLGMAALVMLLFLGIWRNLRRFGQLAREIGSRDGIDASFAEQNKVPELRSVAEDFDRLVATLRNSAESLRRAAEDNAHAFKTPIAVIRQSLEPLKRLVAPSERRGQRALDMIERSAERLDGLVSFARRMDEATADLLSPPRKRVDLSALLERVLGSYASLLAGRRLNLRVRVDPHAVVRASDDLVETIVENILENAVSFSPPEGQINLRLARLAHVADLVIEDEGPGVDAANVERIFERYFSQRGEDHVGADGQRFHRVAVGRVGARLATFGGLDDDEDLVIEEPPAGQSESVHFGIGLWIVRRNVEAIGGTVQAQNRGAGGLRIRIRLPLAH